MIFANRYVIVIWLGFGHCISEAAQMVDIDRDANASDISHDRTVRGIFKSSYWSLPPLCSPASEDSQEYCVYTSSNFANGRGVSIVTNPTEAAAVLDLPAFTDPTLHSRLGLNRPTDTPFAAQQINGRGIGLVANRTIKRGEWLMSFTPAFLMAKEAVDEVSDSDRLHLQQVAIDRLPSKLRRASYALHGQTNGAADDLIDDILDTNTFALPLALDIGDGHDIYEADYKLLFPEIARFNHGCRPTADYIFDSTTLALHVIAYRDVFPGEELTISYIDPLQRQRTRQKLLRRSWGFTCDCAACSASPELVAASDARIADILELQDELADHTKESDGSPLLAEKLISLLRQERLWTLMHDAYFAAAIEYNGVGDATKTQEYARLALNTGQICRGPAPGENEFYDLVQLATDPLQHSSWKFRVQ